MSEPKKPRNITTITPDRTKMPEQPPEERRKNFKEVALGFTEEQAAREADRCIQCKKPLCVPGCPVGIDIPGFIKAIAEKDYPRAYEILLASDLLPAVTGRVCPQEDQCEATCIVGKKLEPVAIGRLERFAADYALAHGLARVPEIRKRPEKVAVIGSGPGGLTCAADCARAGLQVTVFEALHVAGGVLKYGIPEFRLPNAIVDQEIANLLKMGVEIKVDHIVGKIFTIPQLMGEMGYQAVFIATGAGFPKFMGINGEGLNGVMSANEFLTRVNLMTGFEFPRTGTPVGMGKRVATIGAGNTAMDSSRTALRLGAEKSYIVYRRTEKESPARREELHHAIEEGVEFLWLNNPVEILGVEGWVKGMRCIKMELGEPDESGRRSPVPVPGSEFELEVDTVIYALGTKANPIIASTTPGLKTNRWGYLEVDPETQETSIPGVFAGGDIVTGSATVILAMGAGRKAAKGILKRLGIDG
jgi:glutamate synthase (NADPH/NADH) small chain